MKERPILFSGSLPKATIDDLKTQTRRAVKPKIEELIRCHAGDPGEEDDVSFLYGKHLDDDGKEQPEEWLVSCDECPEEGVIPLGQCPYGKPGDRLWVKEMFWAWGRWEARFDQKKGRDAWHFIDMTRECGKNYQFEQPLPIGTRSSVSPAWHKRPSIFMPRHASRITLEIVSVRVERLQEISEADAIAEGSQEPSLVPITGARLSERSVFAALWEHINGIGLWDANPWVWVVEFKRIDQEKQG